MPSPPWTRAALQLLAAGYLAGVWLDGSGTTLPSHVLPRTANYFLQVAALFPRAATMSIDYRAEGWVCRDRAWSEIDTRPYFPIDPNDKENRFQRVMHFFRQDETTMHALDAYLVDSHGGPHDDGIPREAALGGVRLLSLRIPLPKPGDTLERARRRPLPEYPDDERHVFYHTPKSTIAARCSAAGSRE
jgi:hypothetical protein